MQASLVLLSVVGHELILFEWQCRSRFKIGFAAAAPGPNAEPDK
jgi:hypothetical protein